jgi:hypothetical protein
MVNNTCVIMVNNMCDYLRCHVQVYEADVGGQGEQCKHWVEALEDEHMELHGKTMEEAKVSINEYNSKATALVLSHVYKGVYTIDKRGKAYWQGEEIRADAPPMVGRVHVYCAADADLVPSEYACSSIPTCFQWLPRHLLPNLT